MYRGGASVKMRWKLGLAVLILLAVIVGGFCYINANLRPVLRGLAGARVEAVAAKAMNEAIMDMISGESESLIKVYETGGKVYLLQANSGKLNALASACANAAQQKIARLGEQGVTIPVGTVSGVPMLAGKGPKITLHFTPAGAVVSSFNSEFTSAGINQTRHRINVCLTANVRVILPGESQTLVVRAEATIAENIIVGDVPGAYTNVANEEDLLNLIPSE